MWSVGTGPIMSDDLSLHPGLRTDRTGGCEISNENNEIMAKNKSTHLLYLPSSSDTHNLQLVNAAKARNPAACKDLLDNPAFGGINAVDHLGLNALSPVMSACEGNKQMQACELGCNQQSW